MSHRRRTSSVTHTMSLGQRISPCFSHLPARAHSDVDVVGIVHSNSRSLHWSTGMLRDRYEVWVGCVRSASYTIQWVNGNEKRLSPPRYVSYLTGADLGGKTTAVEPSRDIRSEYALQRARVRQIVAERNQ